MSLPVPDQQWWTPAELAEAGLPDLPGTKRGIALLANRHGWIAQPGKARRRTGRGGGWEYHWTLLPMRARKKLITQATPAAPVERPARSDAWAAFEALKDSAKDKARHRLAVLEQVLALETAGYQRTLAVHEVALCCDASPRTIFNWLSMVDFVRRDDWLPALAPRHSQSTRKVETAECSVEAWAALRRDYLREERPSFTSCYDRLLRLGAAEDWVIPAKKTLERRLAREVPPVMLTYYRYGARAAQDRYPPQIRDRSDLHALEAVNADYHKFDVWVTMPSGDVIRPQLCAFQDLYSGRMLSWRIADNPNAYTTALTMGDMIEDYGIPDRCLFDNGREFAAKSLTGGALTRYRFKVLPTDPEGLLTTLGIQVHWATPAHGQAKPIERAFRDIADRVSRHPLLAGAYAGNCPANKPSYKVKPVDFDTFADVVAEGIALHNSRPGRRAANCAGRSFNETFEASYADAPIRRATEEQRRLWMMGATGLSVNPKTAQVAFMDSTYWADFLYAHGGQKVTARFDPADLHAGLHIYTSAGAYLGHAPVQEKGAFFGVDDARHHQRARAAWLKAVKTMAKAEQTMDDIKFAALHREMDLPDDPKPASPKVLRLRGSAAVAISPQADTQEDTDFDAEADFRRGVEKLRVVRNEE